MEGSSIREIAARTLELPLEVALGAIKLVISGRSSVKAINHHGILIYQQDKVVFRTDSGAVEISGSGLSLSELTAEYLRIEGRIDAVRLDGEVHA